MASLASEQEVNYEKKNMYAAIAAFFTAAKTVLIMVAEKIAHDAERRG